MVARGKRIIRENPLAVCRHDAAATTSTSTKNSNSHGKKKKKLSTTTKSVSSMSSKSKNKPSGLANKSKSADTKQKKQMPKIKMISKTRDTSRPPLTPKMSRKPAQPVKISTVDLLTSPEPSDTVVAINPLSPSSTHMGKTVTPVDVGANGFQQAFGPRPSPRAETDESVPLDQAKESPIASFAVDNMDSESFDYTNYSFYSENGTEYDIDNEVTFAMFLTDVKGFLVDKSGQMIPTGPEMVEMVQKTKYMVPESVKNKINHTAHVLDPRDISGGELLASAREIGIVTKDVVVEETVGCAAWSFANLLAGLSLATSAASKTMEAAKEAQNAVGEDDPKAPDTEDQQNIAGDPDVAIVPMQANGQAVFSNGVDYQDDVPAGCFSDAPMVHTMPTKEGTSFPDDNEHILAEPFCEEDQGIVIKNHIEQPPLKTAEHRQDTSSCTSKGMSTVTEESNIDMKEALRQIQDLNAEMERLLKEGNNDNIIQVEVLRKRSRAICQRMAKTSTRAAVQTGRVSTKVSKAVGQASTSIAKSSKKGIGSALLSTSKTMGSLGEKLAKGNEGKDDGTHTTSTGDNSTLSSRSSRSRRSRSSRKSKKSAERKYELNRDGSIVLVTADSRLSRRSGKPPLLPNEF